MRNQKAHGAADLSSDLIASAYDAGVEAWRWPDVMAGLQEFVNCRAALVISYDFRRKSGHVRYAAGISQKFLRSYPRLAALDPWLSSEAMPFELESPCIGKKPSVDQRHFDDRFHREWLEPQNLYHSMLATLATDGEVGEICILLRSKSASSFKSGEVAALDSVLFDLRRAWGIHEAVTAKYDAMLAILDRLPIGVVLVGHGCEVREINELARDIISLDDGVWFDRRILRAGSHSETEHLHTLVALAIDPTKWVHYRGADVIALSRPSGEPAFSALVSPLSASQNVSGDPLVAIFLSEPYRHYDIDSARLQKLYELTPAEARLASLVAQGLTVEGAVKKLNVSFNTVRSHMKKIFAKTGAASQADLVRIILTGVPTIGLPHENESRHVSRKKERSIA